MWLLVALALAADPPERAAAAAPAATTTTTTATTPPATTTSATSLRRTCDTGQLCDGKCIPWTEPCASAVKESLAAMQEADRDAVLQRVLCGAGPTPPPPPAPTLEQRILVGAAAGMLCEQQRQHDPDACREEFAPIVRAPPVSAGPPCSDPPVIAPSPKP